MRWIVETTETYNNYYDVQIDEDAVKAFNKSLENALTDTNESIRPLTLEELCEVLNDTGRALELVVHGHWDQTLYNEAVNFFNDWAFEYGPYDSGCYETEIIDTYLNRN